MASGKALPKRAVVSLWRRLLHYGPVCALSLTGCVTTSTLFCHLQWWPPLSSLLAAISLSLFCLASCLTTINLISAAFVGPGFVPLGWGPENPEDRKLLQYCAVCDGYKAPRSHHCRKCGRCVLKMDHHCPWINNCCGFLNQRSFFMFLVWAVVGCCHASVVLACSIYRALFRPWYLVYGTGAEPIVDLGVVSLLHAIFSFGFAVGVVVAVGVLLVMQARNVLRNRTGIEEYIISKANHRQRSTPFVFPYDLGWRRNFTEVFNSTGRPRGNGIEWPVLVNCNQYTFTMEQIAQKEEKRRDSVLFVACRSFSGSFCPLSFGCRTCMMRPLLTVDGTLPLTVSDHVLVSRWRKRWLYGVLMDNCGDHVRPVPACRGWFPAQCVKEVQHATEAVQEPRSMTIDDPPTSSIDKKHI